MAPEVALMVAVPFPTDVAIFPFMVATLGFEEFQITNGRLRVPPSLKRPDRV